MAARGLGGSKGNSPTFVILGHSCSETKVMTIVVNTKANSINPGYSQSKLSLFENLLW